MSEINTAALETVLAEDLETEETTLETVVAELVETVFGADETISPYKIAKVINGTFEAVGNTKRIPPQMMYNYDRNGMIVKGRKGSKEYNKDEVTTYVLKYANKYL
jgi:hypothetical protein